MNVIQHILEITAYDKVLPPKKELLRLKADLDVVYDTHEWMLVFDEAFYALEHCLRQY
jgi:hypothetical protein